MTAPLSLAAQGVRLTYRGGFSLEVPTLEVAAGHTLALLGPSGSGKSTLLAVLGLLEKPDAGRVLLGGEPVTTRDRAARLKMAAVFQRPYLMKGTVAANVEYGLKLRGVPAAERRGRVVSALERVGLGGYDSRSALSLSGGEAHRVALARALVLEPRVLLLDEPLASLDPLLKRQLSLDFARILRGEGVTIVYVTHDHDEAMVVSQHTAVMRDGRIVTSGSTDDVTGVPADEWTASFLGVEPPVPGRIERASDGLVHVRCEGVEIAAAGEGVPGDAVLLGIRPEDVLIAEAGVEFPLTSARNRLEATVIELEPRGASWHVVMQASGVRIAASVSRAAIDEMRLEVGAAVTAVFKATAVRVRHV
jgi:molybdopterin-binding protein